MPIDEVTHFYCLRFSSICFHQSSVNQTKRNCIKTFPICTPQNEMAENFLPRKVYPNKIGV